MLYYSIALIIFFTLPSSKENLASCPYQTTFNHPLHLVYIHKVRSLKTNFFLIGPQPGLTLFYLFCQ